KLSGQGPEAKGPRTCPEPWLCWMLAAPDLFRVADRNLQRADAVDATFDLVAGVKLGDAGRRARHDDVAGGKRHLLRELPDNFRHVPDQFGEVALLGFGAVDRQPDLALRGMADLRSRLQRGAGRGIVER